MITFGSYNQWLSFFWGHVSFKRIPHALCATRKDKHLYIPTAWHRLQYRVNQEAHRLCASLRAFLTVQREYLRPWIVTNSCTVGHLGGAKLLCNDRARTEQGHDNNVMGVETTVNLSKLQHTPFWLLGLGTKWKLKHLLDSEQTASVSRAEQIRGAIHEL